MVVEAAHTAIQVAGAAGEAGWLLSPIKAADLDGPTGLVTLL